MDLPRKTTLFELMRFIEEELETLRTTDDICAGVLAKAIEATGAKRGFIVLASHGSFRVHHSLMFDGSVVPNQEHEISRTFTRLALASGELVHSEDVALDPRLHDAPREPGSAVVPTPQRMSMRSVAFAPILSGVRVMGALVVDDTRRGAFAKERRDLLGMLAKRAGMVLRRFDDWDTARSGGFPRYPGLIGSAPSFAAVLDQVERVARANVPVLVRGETGTGKELIVAAIHASSPRCSLPLHTVHSSTLAPELLAAELFGHVEGSFTGATQDRIGAFAAADKSTLFLDELGEMTPQIQAMLLRVLQFGEFQRVGSRATERVDVRVVAATHRNLEQMVEDGTFRSDLLHRLNVVTIRLPPLRERREDIPAFVRYFLARETREGAGVCGITDDAMAALVERDYPGNIRDLENTVRRVSILGHDPIRLEDLDLGKAELAVAPLSEEAAIRRAFALTRGNVTKAARLLGIHRGTLQVRYKALGINRADYMR